MNLCGQCQDRTHIDFPSGRRVCEGCEEVPADCACRPVISVPEWVRRMNDREGVTKDYTAA